MMKKNCLKDCFCSKEAFTLIELLVVVLIIGILAAVAMPQYTFAVEKARFAEATTAVSSLQKAIDVWLHANEIPPEGYIEFLGDDANGKGVLDIDITEGMDCSEAHSCSTQNFVYSARCDGFGGCEVDITRRHGDDTSCTVQLARELGNGNWSYLYCGYCEDYPVSQKICKWLEKDKGVAEIDNDGCDSI